jgi:hypothetical protein
MSFQTDREDLARLLEQIHDGKLQLPDFQREWVWDDLRIRDLIASVAQGWPVGAILLLESGGKMKFKLRCFEGAPSHPVDRAQRLALDGQQRLTSLYLALRSGKPVPTYFEEKRKAKGDVLRWYYFDLKRWFDNEYDKRDAILSLPEDRIVRRDINRVIELDLSTPEGEYAAHCIPVTRVFDGSHTEWRRDYDRAHNRSDESYELWTNFEKQVVERMRKYQVPFIQLDRDTDREAVCAVFEKVNQGGKPLDTFELVTATFAGQEEGFHLAEEWAARQNRLRAASVLLHDLAATDFLQAVTLLASYHRRGEPKARAVGCRKEDMLLLPLPDWKAYAQRIEDAFKWCAQLLDRERIYEPKWLPYQNQLIPMAAIAGAIGPRFLEEPARARILRWYWCGMMGELYSGSTETRYRKDMVEVPDWAVGGGIEPSTIRDAEFVPTRLLRLTSRNAAAYKGIMAIYLRAGSADLLRGEEMERSFWFQSRGNNEVDIHHVFPSSWTERINGRNADSILNKTPLTYRTNRSIGGRPPSQYLATIESKGIPESLLNSWLGTHLIPVKELRADDYYGFLRERARLLLDAIEQKTGKPVVGRDSEATIKEFGGDVLHREPPPPPQTVFGDLVVERRILGGNMSEAFLVRSPAHGTAFLKRARLETRDEQALNREQGIYDRLSRVDPPPAGVLAVYDFLRTDEWVGLLLEPATGNLPDWLGARNRTGKTIREVALAVARGLATLHRLDIVHRDLKPANVMYTGAADAPVWKLGDFGVAKYTPRLGTRQTFAGWGTPGFMAPEQQNGAEAHSSADIYSLGKVFCWLLTDGTDPDLILEPAWKVLVAACVHPDPDERPEIGAVIERIELIR